MTVRGAGGGQLVKKSFLVLPIFGPIWKIRFKYKYVYTEHVGLLIYIAREGDLNYMHPRA